MHVCIVFIKILSSYSEIQKKIIDLYFDYLLVLKE